MMNQRRNGRFFRVGPANSEPGLIGEAADILTGHMDSPSSRKPGDVWKHLENEEGIDLGDLALARGLIDEDQLAAASRDHETRGRPMSQYFLEKGLLQPQQIAELVREQQELSGPIHAPAGAGFMLLQEMGRGSVGVVWRGWDNARSRPVALKILHDPAHRPLLEKALQVAGRLSHDSIVPVYAIVEIEGKPALSMGLVEGRALVRGETEMPVRRILEILRDAARAIHHAHGQDVIHGDIKPQNLMIDIRGQVHVLDFGLAGPERSPMYLAPEQLEGSATARSDVYSLGATLHSLVTGTDPFPPGDGLKDRICRDHPPRPGRLKPGLHRDVETIVLKAMEKDPESRYGGAAELAEDIDRYLNGRAILAKRKGWWSRLFR